jgi:hypothetical protein
VSDREREREHIILDYGLESALELGLRLGLELGLM